MNDLFFVLACFVCLTYGAFPHTDLLKTHMSTVESEASTLTSCLHRVTHPLGAASEFSQEVGILEGEITHLETRLETTVTILHVVLAVPFIGEIAAPVLGPASTVLTKASNELAAVNKKINAVVKIIRGWLKPLEVIQKAVGVLNSKIGQVVGIMSKVETEIGKVETCVKALPTGGVKTTATSALEKVSSAIDHVPRALVSPVTSVTNGCLKVQSFLAKIHLVKRKRGLPVLSTAIKVMKKILDAMGPVGTFLDKVNAELNKKICLVGDLLKVGDKVVHKLEHIGQSIKDKLHHIFGRKRLVVMDADFDPRTVRGVDICLSVNQVLHKFRGFTKDMLKQAEKMISGLFHGKLPFHIPGLTGDVLNLHNVLHAFTSAVPKVAMHIAEPLIVNALHMSTNGYVQAIPACVAAIRG